MYCVRMKRSTFFALFLAFALLAFPGILKSDSLILTEDFESSYLNMFPLGWNDVSGSIGYTESLTVVRNGISPTGEGSNGLEIRSLFNTSQGICRPVEIQETYRVELDVYLVEDMSRADNNFPFQVGFGINQSVSGARLCEWPSVKLDIGGADALGGGVCVGPEPQVRYMFCSIEPAVWYHATLEVNTATGYVTTQFMDASGHGAFSLGFHLAGVIGQPYDTVYVAATHMGEDGQQSMIWLDNIQYSSAGEKPGTFLRGDVNSDGGLDLADPISLLGYLYSFQEKPACMDASDVNDDGRIDLADGIKLLEYLYNNLPVLPGPFPYCGSDPTEDDLDCAMSVCGE